MSNPLISSAQRRGRRDTHTVMVKRFNRNVSDGDGGIKAHGDPEILFPAYPCSLYPPTPYTQTTVIQQYGLSANASVMRASGPRSGIITADDVFETDGKTYRVLAKHDVLGATGAPVGETFLLVRVCNT